MLHFCCSNRCCYVKSNCCGNGRQSLFAIDDAVVSAVPMCVVAVIVFVVVAVVVGVVVFVVLYLFIEAEA